MDSDQPRPVFDYSGKVALVTGAASGIGEAVALALIAAGAKVVAADVAPASRRLAAADHAWTVRLDVADEAGWRGVIAAVMAQEAALHLLVNCAGVLDVGGIEAVPPAGLTRMMEVNARGVYIGCREAIAVMKNQSAESAIVNIASANAVKAQSWTSVYAASKAAVLSLTRTTALHCAESRYPIRVNAVLPGIVATPMVERLLAASDDRVAARAQLASNHPIGRLLTAAEIASVVLFLGSPAASGITGAGIAVDGGMTAG